MKTPLSLSINNGLKSIVFMQSRFFQLYILLVNQHKNDLKLPTNTKGINMSNEVQNKIYTQEEVDALLAKNNRVEIKVEVDKSFPKMAGVGFGIYGIGLIAMTGFAFYKYRNGNKAE